MTLKEMLRDDWREVIALRMAIRYQNKASLARMTGWSAMQISNLFNPDMSVSESVITSVCKVLQLPLKNVLKDEYHDAYDQSQTA